MSAPYLVSRSFDIIFALTIGVSAASVRIRREERERWHFHHSANLNSTPITDSLPQSSQLASSSVAPPSNRHASATAVEGRLKNMDHEPTMADTWETLKMRVGKVDVRTWDVRELWKRKNAWGVVEPNQ